MSHNCLYGSARSFPMLTRRAVLMMVAGLTAGLVMAALGYLALDRGLRDSAVAEAQAVAEADAAILAEGLQSELEKFSLVPLVLAEDPDVHAALQNGGASPAKLNERLEQLAGQTGAAAIYLTDAQGTALAASNWRLPTSFVGSNYGFRRYFQNALENGNATQFALGTVSRRPGLYIAQRVQTGDGAIGIVTIKVEFDTLETTWAQATAGVFVTDSDGVVLLTSNPQWRFRTTVPNPPGTRDAEADRRQFGVGELQPMPVLIENRTVVGTSLVEAQQEIAPDGWDLHLLVDATPLISAANATARLATLLAIALTALVCGGLMYVAHRRKRFAERKIAEQTTQLRDQLQQANRLAALGQITAGIGHEIRQPVAAVRVYAETGEKLIDQGDPAAAKDGFRKIVSLADRIGVITDELRRFSRRTPPEPRTVTVGEVVEGAMLLLRDRVRRLGVTIDLPDDAALQTTVRGEHVGLEQVLVNLLQNAIDATGAGGHVAIQVAADQKMCRITVSDNGPGLTADQRDALFRPFATTKADGLGLGLVISQDIMRRLGGTLTANPGDDGASFTMEVPVA